MKKYILAFFLFGVLGLHAESFNFARLDNTNGLSNNQIKCIFKDSRGFMWFGTNYGLNRYDGYRVKIYKSVKNDTTSLNSNSINDIQEDYNGNLWIGNNNGYCIYNILNENFNRNLSPLLSEFGIHFKPSIVEIDKQKNFYFYEANHGLFEYDIKNKKLIRFIIQSKNFKSTISSIKAQNDFIWILFTNGLIERFNKKLKKIDFSNTFITHNDKGSTLTKRLFIDADGSPWIYPGLMDKGTLYFDMKKKEWSCFGNNIKNIPGSILYSISSNLVRSIEQDKKGRVWIGTDHGGIEIFNKTSKQLILLRNDPANPNSISQNSVISLHCDKTGIMWVGTYKNGVSYFYPGIFKFEKSPLFFFNNSELENKDCNAIHEDRKGNLWIGTNGSGVLKLDSKIGKFKLYRNQEGNSSSISSNIIISILENKNGTMWFGTFWGGLNKMVGERFQNYQPELNNPNSLSNNSVYGLVEDRNQNIWIATLGSGLDELNKSRNNFSHHKTNYVKGISSNYIVSLFSKDSMYIYLCTSVGIDVLNTSTRIISPLFKDSSQKNKLSDLTINNVLLDKKNQIWIATDNGINIYNPANKTIEYIDKSSGLPSDQVVSLVEDNNGNIWAGTRNGLTCVYCKQDPVSKKTVYSVVSFDENDGLLSSIFNQNAIFKNKQGKIYIGCTKGYTVFDPQNIHYNTIAPQPRFTELLIGNEEVEPGSTLKKRIVLDSSIVLTNKIELHYNEKNFTVNFSAMSYIHPQKNKYRYKLEGFDENWIDIKNGIGSVSYSNLNQGTYQLKVYASNNDNVWSKSPLVLSIVILPPFWLSWWAYCIYFILSLIALWSIVKFNLRKQKKQFERENREREIKQLHEIDEMKFRFFTNVSHEFRTPLTLIINPIEKLLKEAKTDEEKSVLSIIQRNANGLLELVNQLLDFRKLDVHKDTLNLAVGDVVTYIKDICYSFTDMANQKMISFSFSTSIQEFQMEFDPAKMKKIIYNLLSNAFKFTPKGGKIDVNMSLIVQQDNEQKTLRIDISDTGTGIPEKDLNRIFDRFYRVENAENGHQTGTGVGLHIVSEYVKLHEGSINVESQIGKGSVFTIQIPARLHIQEEIISLGLDLQEKSNEPKVEEETTLIAEDSRNKLPLMLIVDDNEDFREFISSMFIENYRILKAEDGKIAYQLILEKMPDLVISDVMMPNMDGFELCRLMKQDIRISHIPIILLTAKDGEENKYHGLESGAEDYIPKPFNMEMLSLKVKKIVDRQKKIRDQFKHKVDITLGEVQIVSLDEKFVKKAVALVEANISTSEFLVEDLCREMGMSRVYFYKKILALTDKTPSEFIRFIRLKRAADLLEKSQLFVNEVAFQVGFNDPKYFRKYFKDEFGVSPNEYKKKFSN